VSAYRRIAGAVRVTEWMVSGRNFCIGMF